MKTFWLWLLKLIFGSKIVAAEQGAEAGIKKFEAQEQAQAVAVVQEREEKIDADAAKQKAEVAATPDGDVAAVMDGVFAQASKHNQDRSS